MYEGEKNPKCVDSCHDYLVPVYNFNVASRWCVASCEEAGFTTFVTEESG